MRISVIIMVKNWRIIGLFCLVGLVLSFGVNARTSNPNGSHTVVSPDGRILLGVFHTESKTWVNAQNTANMSIISKWQIDNFRPQNIEFAANDSTKLLLADNKRVLVYRLTDEQTIQVFEKEVDNDQVLVNATFGPDGESIIWATEDTINRSPLDTKIDIKLAAVRSNQGKIKAIVALNEDQYIALLENDAIIYIYSRTNTIFAKELKGHQRPVVSVLTSDGRTLFSLGERQELIIWDLGSYNIIRRLRLGDLDNPALVEAASFDRRKNALLVQTQKDDDEFGAQYDLSDLVKGIVNPKKIAISTTDSGKVYASTVVFSPNKIDGTALDTLTDQRSRTNFSGTYESTEDVDSGNSFYELAKIEADNENYEAALDFIKRVPENDPEYRLSRELRKTVLQKIDAKNSLVGAVEQYKSGNYRTAKIILENILAKDPDHKVAKRYLKLTEDKISPSWLSVFGILFLIIIGLIAAGAVIWKFKPEWIQMVLPAKKKTTVEDKGKEEEEEKEEKPQDSKAYRQRKAFILKLNATRRMLKKAITIDREGRHKDKWLEYSATINDIEKRAKKNDKYLPGLSRQLDKVQEKILRLVPAAKLSSKAPQNGEQPRQALPGSEKQDKKKKTTEPPQKKKQIKSLPDPRDSRERQP